MNFEARADTGSGGLPSGQENGHGRESRHQRVSDAIGRNVSSRHHRGRARTDIEVVAINDPSARSKPAPISYRYDSVHGRFPATVTVDGDTIDVGRGPIKVTALRDPRGTALVGRSTWCWNAPASSPRKGEVGQAHLENGSSRVLISAPWNECRQDHRLRRQSRDIDEGRHRRLERVRAPRNCLAPVAKVLNDENRHRARLS